MYSHHVQTQTPRGRASIAGSLLAQKQEAGEGPAALWQRAPWTWTWPGKQVQSAASTSPAAYVPEVERHPIAEYVPVQCQSGLGIIEFTALECCEFHLLVLASVQAVGVGYLTASLHRRLWRDLAGVASRPRASGLQEPNLFTEEPRPEERPQTSERLPGSTC